MDILIKFELENKRAAAYDGTKLAGECSISPSESMWIIDHTQVDPAYGGRGLAGKLVKAVVDAAREAKVSVIPLCPFAKKEFDKHPEYRALL